MGNRETRFIGKKTVESQSEKKNSIQSQESSSKSYLERAKNGVGIAFADAFKAAEVTRRVRLWYWPYKQDWA